MIGQLDNLDKVFVRRNAGNHQAMFGERLLKRAD
jgi:hypothetical protein